MTPLILSIAEDQDRNRGRDALALETPQDEGRSATVERDRHYQALVDAKFQQIARLTYFDATALSPLQMDDINFCATVVKKGVHGIVWELNLKEGAILARRAKTHPQLLAHAVEMFIPHTFHHDLVNDTLLHNPHLGIANISALFHGPKQDNLDNTACQSHCLVPETERPIDLQQMHSASCITPQDKATYIVREMGMSELREKEGIRLHPRKLQELAFQLLSTVDFLNSRGVFHLNIDVTSIQLIRRSGFDGHFYVLCDFGDAVYIDPSGLERRHVYTDILSGNMKNRAPETVSSFRPTPAPTTPSAAASTTTTPHNDGRGWYNIAKTDVWAVGCVLWRLCCGNHTDLFNSEKEVIDKPIELGYLLKQDCPCVHTLIERILDRNFDMRPSAAHAAAFVGAEMFLDGGIAGLCESLRSLPRQEKAVDWLQSQMYSKKNEVVAEQVRREQQATGGTSPVLTPVSTLLEAVFLQQTSPQLLLDSLPMFMPEIPQY
ncbi:hypothetical protein Pelo_13691 [Pelomyxa schiedti]|nr:hypothetical protein Pelo_13691 [Pelomyxa schiedti]